MSIYSIVFFLLGEAQTQEDAPTAQAKLMKLQEEICALKEERDFLREQLKAALQRPNAGPSSGLSPGKWMTSNAFIHYEGFKCYAFYCMLPKYAVVLFLVVFTLHYLYLVGYIKW